MHIVPQRFTGNTAPRTSFVMSSWIVVSDVGARVAVGAGVGARVTVGARVGAAVRVGEGEGSATASYANENE